MKYVFLFLMFSLCGIAGAAATDALVSKSLNPPVIKTIPEVNKDAGARLNALLLEGQAYQLQLNQLEKGYRDIANQSNANLEERKLFIIDTVKKAGLDPETYTIEVSIKGVATFVAIPPKTPKN